MKTIIQVWSHYYYNKKPDKFNNFYGIGDILRGTMNLYLYCRKNNYNFVVDIHLHKLSEYIIENNHLYRNLIERNKNNIPFVKGEELDKFINNSTEDTIFLFTNLNKQINNPDEDTINFMKNLLKPKQDLQNYIDKYLEIYNNFNIMHFRLGDNELVRNNNNKDFKKYLNILEKIPFSENDILISDSNTFKKFIEKKKIKIKILKTNPSHIGLNNDLKDTLLEFFLLSRAKKINSYSVHRWNSGFVRWNSIIFKKDVVFIK